MPKNPTNRIFLHKGKKPHICLGLAITSPGRWGVSTISRSFDWNLYDLKKAVIKMEAKGLVVIKNRKLYATEFGTVVYAETLDHIARD